MDFNEAKDDAVTGWQWQIGQTICKQSAPYYRQTTTQTPHNLIFMGQMLFSTKMCSASFKKLLNSSLVLHNLYLSTTFHENPLITF